MPYDALKAPDPEDWLDLDDQERIDQVIEYHLRDWGRGWLRCIQDGKPPGSARRIGHDQHRA